MALAGRRAEATPGTHMLVALVSLES